MKRTKRLTRRQIKNAKALLEDLQGEEKPTFKQRKLTKALNKEVKKQETKLSTGKPRVIEPIFGVERYFQKKTEARHTKAHEREDKRAAKADKKVVRAEKKKAKRLTLEAKRLTREAKRIKRARRAAK